MQARRLASLAPLLLVLACSSVPPEASRRDPSAARLEIESAMATLVQLSEAKNGQACANLHTDDALLLPPGVDPIEGRAAVLEFLSAPSTATVSDTSIETLRLDVDGDHAYHVGRYRYELTEGQSTETVSGRFVMVWRREDAGWRVAIDIWALE